MVREGPEEKMEVRKMKKIFKSLLVGALIFSTTNMMGTSALAEESEYSSVVKQIEKKCDDRGYEYAYKDVYGNKGKELIISYHENGGSGSTIKIFTLKNNKPCEIAKFGLYGFDKLSAYEKSKSMIVYSRGHGGETYSYYRLSNGKYVFTASKSRQSVNGGGVKNGKYGYNASQYKTITKKKFDNLTKNFTRGKLRVFRGSEFKMK